MKLELFTLGRNSLLMRVENIGDVYDSNGEVIYQEVLLHSLAEGLYKLVNGDSALFRAKISEMSLTGNQLYESMASTKIQWATVDDAETAKLGQSHHHVKHRDTKDAYKLQ